MPVDVPCADLMNQLTAGDEQAATLVFNRYARRLIGLAARHIPERLRAKIDPEEAVISAFESFFARLGHGQFDFDDWDNLWTLLTVITVRKCGHKLEHFTSQKRDVSRESSLTPKKDGPEREVASPQPTAGEVVALAETVERVLADLRDREKDIVLLSLQGFGKREVAGQLDCAEHIVHRTLRKVRTKLETMRAE